MSVPYAIEDISSSLDRASDAKRRTLNEDIMERRRTGYLKDVHLVFNLGFSSVHKSHEGRGQHFYVVFVNKIEQVSKNKLTHLRPEASQLGIYCVSH